MNEVDKIIIRTLQNIEINLEGAEILNDLSVENVPTAISKCLNYINPELNLSTYYPQNINGRYKFCNKLVEECKTIGFPDVLGCETIMYKQVNEIRKLFMFLIEKFPKAKLTTPLIPNSNYTLKRKIETKFKDSLNTPYFPFYKWNRSRISNISTYCLRFHDKIDSDNEYVPSVIQQCANSKYSLISSIIDWNSARCYIKNKKLTTIAHSNRKCTNILSEYFEKLNINNNSPNYNIPKHMSNLTPVSCGEDIKPQDKDITTDVMAAQHQTSPKIKLTKLNRRIEKINKAIEDIELKLSESNKFKVDLLSQLNQGNTDKSKLDNEWSIVNSLKVLIDEPEKYKLLQQSILTTKNSMEKEYQSFVEEKAKLNAEIDRLEKVQSPIRDEILSTVREIESMEETLSNLSHKIHELNEKIKKMEDIKVSEFSRLEFTRRILEITQSIKSHRSKIQKIFTDISNIYKEASLLNNNINISFKECNSMILKDAAIDTFYKNSYLELSKIILNFEKIIEMIQKRNSLVQCSKELEDAIISINEQELDANLEKIAIDYQMLLKQ